MKSSLLRAGSALLLGLAFTAMGCQEDNEAAINEQATKTAGAAVAPSTGPPPPKTNAERAAQHEASKPAPTKGYPGVR